MTRAASTHFHGPGIRAALSSHGERCLLEVSVDRSVWPEADSVEMDVLYQARGTAGLAVGSPAVLHRASLPLRTLRNDPRAFARVWLPQGLRPETARNCHYRVVPVIIQQRGAPAASAARPTGDQNHESST